MSDLLKRIANYFANEYNGDDITAPKMELSVDELRYIASMRVDKCRAEAELRELKNKRYPRTNADRIRSMSDEEFAEFWLKSCDNPIMIYNEDICYLCDIYEGSVQCDDEYCKEAIVKWLQSEVEE